MLRLRFQIFRKNSKVWKRAFKVSFRVELRLRVARKDSPVFSRSSALTTAQPKEVCLLPTPTTR